MPRKAIRPRKGQRKKRKPNSGSFTKGPDTRRHVFSRAEARVGYQRAWEVMAARGWDALSWLCRKVRGEYPRTRRESHGSEEE